MNAWGQLGDGTTNDSNEPVQVSMTGALSGKTVRALSVGVGGYACMIASDGKVYCWGYNANGQLGNGTYDGNGIPHSLPAQIVMNGALNGKTVKQISCGAYHNCVVASDGKAYCWGFNSDGELGNGATTSWPLTLTPTPVYMNGALLNKTIKTISASTEPVTCAIASDSKVYCWGTSQSFYGLNLFSYTAVPVSSNVPLPINMGPGSALFNKLVRSITLNYAGGGNKCVVADDNKAYCWGNNKLGQLGDGSAGDNNAHPDPQPVLMTNAMNGKLIGHVISGGSGHVCTITQDNFAYCWGINYKGQLGDGTTNNSHEPVAVIYDNVYVYPGNNATIPTGVPSGL